MERIDVYDWLLFVLFQESRKETVFFSGVKGRKSGSQGKSSRISVSAYTSGYA
jgi:hypothetical protein